MWAVIKPGKDLHSYIKYGLGIRSEIELQGLREAAISPDIFVSISEFDPSPSRSRLTTPYFWANNREICFSYQGIGDFLIREGREILVNPKSGADNQILAEYILDPGLEILLHQRGSFVFHGSAVMKEGHAVIFLGDSGLGKSTIAAALCTAGCSPVADDLAIIGYGGNDHIIFPGAPQFMLHEDVADSLGCSQDKCKPHALNTDKSLVPFPHNDQHKTAKVSLIFILKKGSTNSIQSIPAQEAFIELLHHTRTSYLLGVPDSPPPLQRYANLIRNVGIKRLSRTQDINLIPDLSNIVRRELEDIISKSL